MGDYDKSSHGGAGKNQNLYPPAVGTDYRKKTRGNRNPVGTGHAMQKDHTSGSDYQEDAHAHKGKDGAVGKKGDSALEYPTKLHEEGLMRGGASAGNHVMKMSHGTTNKAEHLPRAGEPHKFDRPSTREAHSFGHPAHLRSGCLRNSGHSGAHRIGKK